MLEGMEANARRSHPHSFALSESEYRQFIQGVQYF